MAYVRLFPVAAICALLVPTVAGAQDSFGGSQQPPQQQGGFPPQQQGGFPPQQQGGFPPQQQGGFPPQQQGGFPPQQQGGFPPQQQGGFPPQQQGFPPQQGGFPEDQGDYPPQQGGIPPQQSGFPPQQSGFPPQQGGIPPQQGGIPPQQGGVPPQQGGVPPQQGGFPPQQQGPNLEQLAQMEQQNFGVQPTQQLYSGQMHAPTPVSITRGQVVTTQALVALMQGNRTPYFVFDVLGGPQTLPNAIHSAWMAQPGTFNDQTQQQVAQMLQQGTQGRRDVALVFYCLSNQCWMSYNAALRAINAGYTNVLWYRGGIEAWQMAGLPTQPAQPAFAPQQ